MPLHVIFFRLDKIFEAAFSSFRDLFYALLAEKLKINSIFSKHKFLNSFHSSSELNDNTLRTINKPNSAVDIPVCAE